MISEVILQIKRDKTLYNYLKYHSKWYEILKDSPYMVKELIKEMKKELKMNTEDKLSDLSTKIEMVRAFLEVLG